MNSAVSCRCQGTYFQCMECPVGSCERWAPSCELAPRKRKQAGLLWHASVANGFLPRWGRLFVANKISPNVNFPSESWFWKKDPTFWGDLCCGAFILRCPTNSSKGRDQLAPANDACDTWQDDGAHVRCPKNKPKCELPWDKTCAGDLSTFTTHM